MSGLPTLCHDICYYHFFNNFDNFSGFVVDLNFYCMCRQEKLGEMERMMAVKEEEIDASLGYNLLK